MLFQEWTALVFPFFSLAAVTFASIESAKANRAPTHQIISCFVRFSLRKAASLRERDKNDQDTIVRLYFLNSNLFFSNVHLYITPDLPSAMNNGTVRANIKEGLNVGIVLKADQRTGKITRGIVKRILTNSSTHPHGIKVQLTDGQVGRVKEIY